MTPRPVASPSSGRPSSGRTSGCPTGSRPPGEDQGPRSLSPGISSKSLTLRVQRVAFQVRAAAAMARSSSRPRGPGHGPVQLGCQLRLFRSEGDRPLRWEECFLSRQLLGMAWATEPLVEDQAGDRHPPAFDDGLSERCPETSASSQRLHQDRCVQEDHLLPPLPDLRPPDRRARRTSASSLSTSDRGRSGRPDVTSSKSSSIRSRSSSGRRSSPSPYCRIASRTTWLFGLSETGSGALEGIHRLIVEGKGELDHFEFGSRAECRCHTA